MSELTQPMTPQEQEARLKAALTYSFRTGYSIQTGAETNAPAVIFADADYEVGDEKVGLWETQKYANEPAIVYVRSDALPSILDELDNLRHDVGRYVSISTELATENEALRKLAETGLFYMEILEPSGDMSPEFYEDLNELRQALNASTKPQEGGE